MTPEVSAAVIGALVGGVVAYVAGWLQKLADTRRSRRALASLFLAELRAAEVTLRNVYDAPNGIWGTDAFGAFGLIQEALAAFRPSTVRMVVDVGAYLTNIREMSLQLVDGKLDPRILSHNMQMLSYAALQRVPAAKAALEREGGHLDAFTPIDVPAELSKPTSRALPELPPPAFADINLPRPRE